MSAINPGRAELSPVRAVVADRDSDSDRIQTLRGVACVLLVLFHVIGSPSSGLRMPEESVLHFLTELFTPLRMPLFTFLSGFVYAYRPVTAGAGSLFLGKKVRRLILPLLAVSTIHFVVQSITPGTSEKTDWSLMWEIYFYPYEHFWFLQAIALIFVLVACLDHFRILDSFAATLFALVLTLSAQAGGDAYPAFFSIGQAVYLLPFFLAGLAANRFKKEIWRVPLKVLAPVALAAAWLPYAFAVWGPADPPASTSAWAELISMAGILSLMFFMPSVRLLARIGGYSFSIYLYHVFFTAGERILLGRVFELPPEVHLVLGLAAGLAGPILVETMLSRNRIARNVLLGQS